MPGRLRCWVIWAVLAAALDGSRLRAEVHFPLPSDTAITLRRVDCEEGCPTYRVMVFPGGDVIWEGIRGVRRTGVELTHIPPEQVLALIEALEAADYWKLPDIYGLNGAGCSSSRHNRKTPWAVTVFTMGGQSHSITHDLGCVADVADKLTSLEEKIDKVAGTSRWIK